MKILIKTQFDCTATGTTGHYRSNKVPYQDHADQTIDGQDAWNKSRNQQRNYETLIQLLSLRTQLIFVGQPQHQDGIWSFEIESDRDDVFSDDFASLILDCEAVPMIVGLDETAKIAPMLVLRGDSTNLWFSKVQ